MKRYELKITGRRIIDLEDNESIEDYVDAIIEGDGDKFDTYSDLDELIDDMEFGGLDWKKI